MTDWSGNPDFKPQLEPGTLKVVPGQHGRPCIKFDMVSHHAGLASVKLVANDGEGNIVGEKHDFLMIWLTIGDVVIDEVGANDPTGDAPAGSNAEVGDPAGDGVFAAGDPFGRVSVNVTGTFPGSAKLGGGTITLPGRLAGDRRGVRDRSEDVEQPRRQSLGHPRRPDQGDRPRPRASACTRRATTSTRSTTAGTSAGTSARSRRRSGPATSLRARSTRRVRRRC